MKQKQQLDSTLDSTATRRNPLGNVAGVSVARQQAHCPSLSPLDYSTDDLPPIGGVESSPVDSDARRPPHPAVRVVLPLRTVSEANGREHWARKAKRAKAQRRTAFCLAPAASLPAVVTLTRLAPRELDDDNLRPALKACRDGIADRLGINDRDPRVRWQYAQQRGGVREYAVLVDIEPATPARSET